MIARHIPDVPDEVLRAAFEECSIEELKKRIRRFQERAAEAEEEANRMWRSYNIAGLVLMRRQNEKKYE